jgi:hypothetical protein
MSEPNANAGWDAAIARLRCPVVFWGLLQVPAEIAVFPGRVECRFKPLWGPPTSGSPLIHRRMDVVIVRSRALPYPFRTSIELVSDAGQKVYLSPYHGLQGIIAALGRAGFSVHQRKVWLVPLGSP